MTANETFTCGPLSCRLTRQSCGRRWVQRNLAAGVKLLTEMHAPTGDPCRGCETGARHAEAFPAGDPVVRCAALNINAEPCGAPLGRTSRYCNSHRRARSRWQGWQVGDSAVSPNGAVRVVEMLDHETRHARLSGLGTVTFERLARWDRLAEGAA